MSKKPSENQNSDRNFPESFFRSSNAPATNNEENSLERRLFCLIGNELRRTTAQNEFATLENRIIRILRNEFVNDIMTEINTSNDEIATFFNRFIRSVPELNDLCERIEGTSAERRGCIERPKTNEVNSKVQKDDKKTFGARLDENNIGVVLEMFRAPILVTCRACEDMRRIIRSGRRMIREIQLIAAMRSDLNSLRRIEMKCVEELDHVGNLRYRRQASTFGNWRQLFRRRCRNIQPSPGGDRGLYYVVFDRPNKPRLAQLSPKAKYTMLIKLRKRGKGLTGKMSSEKHRTKLWDEFSTKTEIGRILQAVRRVCLLSSSSSQTSPSEILSFPNLVECTTQLQEDCQINLPNIAPLTGDVQESNGGTNLSLLQSVIIPSVSESTHLQERNEIQSQISPSLPQDQNETIPEEISEVRQSQTDSLAEDIDTASRNDPLRPFSVMLRTGTVEPQDVTVVLYSDRVLVASIAQRSVVGADGWSGWLQRRWVLPEHVDEDKIRCFLGEGSLVITVYPCTDVEWAFGSDLQDLGPPNREPYPYPHPYTPHS